MRRYFGLQNYEKKMKRVNFLKGNECRTSSILVR